MLNSRTLESLANKAIKRTINARRFRCKLAFLVALLTYIDSIDGEIYSSSQYGLGRVINQTCEPNAFANVLMIDLFIGIVLCMCGSYKLYCVFKAKERRF